MDLHIKTITSPEEIRSLKTSWDQLYSHHPNVSLFMLWEWIESFLENMDPPLKILHLSDSAGEPFALIPYIQGKLPLNKFIQTEGIVLALGHFGWPSQLDLLCKAGGEKKVSKGLIDWLQGERWNFVSLRRFDQNSPFLRESLPLLSKTFRVFKEPPAKHPALTLPSSIDEVIAGLKKAFRKKVTYENRRLFKQFDCFFGMVEKREDLGEIFEKMMELHTGRIQEKNRTSDLSTDPQILQFHRSFCEKTLERGALRMAYLKMEGRVVAVRYDVRVKDTVFHYNAGIDSEYAKYSLGNVIAMKALEKYLAEGVKELNMLPNMEYYKLMWADHLKYDENIILLRPGLKGKFYGLLNSLFHKLKQQARKKEYEGERDLREKLQSFLRLEMPL